MANYLQEIGEVSKIKLHGHIDASIAPALMEELKPLIAQKDKVKKLVFYADELEYIASAGIRAVVFAKQKLGGKVQVYLIGASEMILDVFKMTGIDKFLTIQDTFAE
ncbi:MAG: STAS domain-containing protein [Selenomonadaceae bacterium]|nr:STAS domain-containing protein [Selenomonadaceae bacterium]